MTKYDFNNVALQVRRHEYSPVNLLHIFRIPFYKNIYGGLLLQMIMFITFLFFSVFLKYWKLRGKFVWKLSSASLSNTPTTCFNLLMGFYLKMWYSMCDISLYDSVEYTNVPAMSDILLCDSVEYSNAPFKRVTFQYMILCDMSLYDDI